MIAGTLTPGLSLTDWSGSAVAALLTARAPQQLEKRLAHLVRSMLIASSALVAPRIAFESLRGQ